jgi:hypothetical protein
MFVDTNGFALGDVARDPVTGVEGTIVSFHQYQTGCARASLQAKVGADGKVPDALGVDVLLLELVSAGPDHEAPAAPATIGGPHSEPPTRSDPAQR